MKNSNEKNHVEEMQAQVRLGIGDFLSLEKPENFDFTAEFAEDFYKQSSVFEKYFIYKAHSITEKKWADVFQSGNLFVNNIKMRFKEVDDPDVKSILLNEIFELFWVNLKELKPHIFNQEEGRFYCDTMTSVQYTMQAIFEFYVESIEEKKHRESIFKHQECSLKYIFDTLSKRMEDKKPLVEKIEIMAKELEKVKDKEYMGGFEVFLSSWHTPGNYCPVPQYFNVSRANFGKCDFWDYTLEIIKGWYDKEDEKEKKTFLKEHLFGKYSDSAVDNCHKWLKEGFKDWKDFVATLFFQDWVDENYNVIPLYKGHSIDNAFGKQIEATHIPEFFENYSQRIRSRGKRMIDELKRLKKLK